MIKKVTLIRGVGNYSKRFGYSAHERLVIAHAEVSDVSDCYFLISGKALVYKGKKSMTLLREEYFNRKIKKISSWLTLEDVPNSSQFIVEEAV